MKDPMLAVAPESIGSFLISRARRELSLGS